MKKVSLLASWLLMPILMPCYALLLVMYTPSVPYSLGDGNSLYLPSSRFKLLILLYFFLFTAVIPSLMYLFLKSTNVIKTVQLDSKEERKAPMILMVLFCLFLYYMLQSAQSVLPKYTYALCLSGAVVVGIFTFVNQYMKVSLHAAGAGILTGFVFAYCWEQIYFQFSILIVVVLISGIVLSSRLFLEKHSPKELIVGYFFSLFVTFALNLYFPMKLVEKVSI
jgi:hypothetical protein